MMQEMVFLVEGFAEKAFFATFLPRLLPSASAYTILRFNGKQDLEKSIARILKNYQNPKARFIIMRDQDAGDCHKVKAKLVQLATQSGDNRPRKIRVACRALESWYLAQLAVVGNIFAIKNLAAEQRKAKFRNPDHLHSPDSELAALTNKQYDKIYDSERLGRALDVSETRSPSFANFIKAVQYLAELP